MSIEGLLPRCRVYKSDTMVYLRKKHSTVLFPNYPRSRIDLGSGIWVCNVVVVTQVGSLEQTGDTGFSLRLFSFSVFFKDLEKQERNHAPLQDVDSIPISIFDYIIPSPPQE